MSRWDRNRPNRSVGGLAKLRPTSRRLSAFELDLYDHISADLRAKTRVVSVPFILGGYDGMTLGPFVLLKQSLSPDGHSLLLAHELVHVRQWKELGTRRFLRSYLSDFVKGLKTHRSWRVAYRAIGLEVEARDLANEWQKRHSSTE